MDWLNHEWEAFLIGKPTAVGQAVVAAVRIAGIIALALLVFAVARKVISRLSARVESSGRLDEVHRRRAATFAAILLNITRYAIIFLGLVMVLREMGLNPTPILAGAGVVGLAVGFGAQNLVRDVVSGFFILLEDQYAVGDLVEINGVFGVVEEVGLRMTRLRDSNGELRYFANGSVTTVNHFTDRCLQYVVNVPVPREAEATALALLSSAMESFHREFNALAETPTPPQVIPLGQNASLVQAAVKVIPTRQALLEQKLPPRLTAALAEREVTLLAGHDLSIFPHSPAFHRLLQSATGQESRSAPTPNSSQ